MKYDVFTVLWDERWLGTMAQLQEEISR
ncbi:unnamed protein product, partial [Rotaria magnacalcarata]